jgi:hypothetical protein
MAIALTATNKSIELGTGSAGSIDYSVSYNDVTVSSFTPGDSQGNIITATTTVIVSGPGTGVSRAVKSITIYNKNTSANAITLKKDVGGTEYTLFTCVLDPNESLIWSDGQDWSIFDSSGRKKVNLPISSGGVLGRSIPFYKVGSAPDAAAYWYCFSKDNGFPGTWSTGTPGTGGRNTSGTDAADAGCLPLWTPTTGNLYLKSANIAGTVLQYYSLMDILWVNTALSVTATGAQTITMSGPLPARDINGNTSGVGCVVGILNTGTNTNAAAISNSTINYTNSSGTGSRTATLSNFAGDMIPATMIIGTVTLFQQQAGDVGVQSVQSISLGSAVSAGSFSVFIARPILTVAATVLNVGAYREIPDPGIRLYNGSCLHWFLKATANTATTISGDVTVIEK